MSPFDRFLPPRLRLFTALMPAIMLATFAASMAWAQGRGVIEESDSILGKNPEEAAAAAPTVVSRVGYADVRAIMLFHPLMQYLVSTTGNSPLLYFLPPGSTELAKLFDERRAKRLAEVTSERLELAQKSSALLRELEGLRAELNKRLGGSEAAAESRTAAAKAGQDAAGRKLDEEGFWAKKQDLEQRLSTVNGRYASLMREIQDPLALLEQTRQAIVARIKHETDEAIGHVAEAHKLAVVMNAYSPSLGAGVSASEVATDPTGSIFIGNEYKEFLSSKAPVDRKEPTVRPRRLLVQWQARAAKVGTIFGPGAAQTVLWGGRDVTWPVLEEILLRYKVPQAQLALVKAHFEARRER